MHARLGIIIFAAAILDMKFVRKHAAIPAVTVKAWIPLGPCSISSAVSQVESPDAWVLE